MHFILFLNFILFLFFCILAWYLYFHQEISAVQRRSPNATRHKRNGRPIVAGRVVRFATEFPNYFSLTLFHICDIETGPKLTKF